MILQLGNWAVAHCSLPESTHFGVCHGCRYFEKAAKEVLKASERHCNGKKKAPAAPIGCFTFLKKPKPLADLSVRQHAVQKAGATA